MSDSNHVLNYQETAGTVPGCAKRPFEVFRTTHRQGFKRHVHNFGCDLQFLETEDWARCVWIPDNSNTGGFRERLLEKFEPFATQLSREIRNPCYITARSRETGNKPLSDGITAMRHDDRS